MRILITGGAGFLGLHLARYLVKKKQQVILIDISNFDKREYSKKCTFVKADVRNVQLINQLTKSIDVVIHAAAALPLWKDEEIMDINVNGTQVLLEAALKHKVKQFIYISSTAVYGVPKKHPIFESDPLVGVGSYGKSKIAAEGLCQTYQKKGLLVTVLRPKTFIGTYRLGVFEILFDWIKDGKRIPVIGSGNNHYQLLDVDDITEAIYHFIVLRDHAKANGIFNIGAERYSTVRKDLQKVFDYAHSGSSILATPAFFIKKALWLFEKLKLSPLYQWVYDTADKDSYVSVKKLVQTLHWHPRYSNSDALVKSYRWYQKHYKEIKSRPEGVTHTVGWKQGILGLFKKLL